jgi:pSer/pThr/pTyr-binding forkhead associated (FHA) protein
MKLSLVVLTAGNQQGKALDVKLAQFVIGRDPQCHLRPASPMISKRHCAVLQRDNKAFLRDFDSTNGTFVNDQPVKGEVELHDGDTLKVGPLMFTVKLDLTAPVNRPTPAPPTKQAAKTAATSASDAEAPAKKLSMGDKTPLPATKAKTEDEDIAAMLLSIGDDDGASSGAGAPIIPEGSTQMEIMVPPGSAPDGSAGSDKPDEKKKDEKKPASATASSSSAAKSILDQLMKRPR